MKRMVLTLCIFFALSSLANAAALIECYDPNTGKTIKTSKPTQGMICEGIGEVGGSSPDNIIIRAKNPTPQERAQLEREQAQLERKRVQMQKKAAQDKKYSELEAAVAESGEREKETWKRINANDRRFFRKITGK